VGMNQHNSSIIKFNYQNTPRCARGVSQIMEYGCVLD
jgi:hypothetical protein